ncbi:MULTISPECIES: hypothetical protein [Spirulina sp. CCY15215]|uniref:hypothetical protein n=1 Tax=Spirulina sp. CCY15215 TaxID=2767591 RepID=UPI00195036AB|nr:hypothetical protein [Spirulina major]
MLPSNLLFTFRPEHMAGLINGTLKIVTSNGVALGMVRDAATGRFIAHAVGTGLNPLIGVVNPVGFIMGGIQMIQTHRGFQKVLGELNLVQASIGVLQTTTAFIGVGTVAGVALSAVNLWQILKLREDVKNLRLEVKDGFLDLKQALKDQESAILQRINDVANDIKFEQHRLVLVQAYGNFTQAVQRLRSALKVSDPTRRNAEIDAVRGMLYQALAEYTNPQLVADLSAAGWLRRAECSWLISQVIILTYHLQNEMNAVSDRLQNLQNQISQDLRTIIDRCNSSEELDFLFPEITRLKNHDVAILRTWQAHVDWIQELSPSEMQELENLEADRIENVQVDVLIKPEEISSYENFKEKSHYFALRDQLRFMVNPKSRRDPEVYISQMATNTGRKALVPSNWLEVPDFTVANLYWYFKQQETAIS